MPSEFEQKINNCFRIWKPANPRKPIELMPACYEHQHYPEQGYEDEEDLTHSRALAAKSKSYNKWWEIATGEKIELVETED